MREPPKIIDAIITPQCQMFLLLDRMPEFRYRFEKNQRYLVAEDGPFVSCLGYERSEYSKAFAGAKFKIPLEDGGEVQADGQWWSSFNPDLSHGDYCSPGIGTIENLKDCYVFMGSTVRRDVVEDWLAKNPHKTEYEAFSPTRLWTKFYIRNGGRAYPRKATDKFGNVWVYDATAGLFGIRKKGTARRRSFKTMLAWCQFAERKGFQL